MIYYILFVRCNNLYQLLRTLSFKVTLLSVITINIHCLLFLNKQQRPYIQVSLEKNPMIKSRSKRELNTRDLTEICANKALQHSYCCRHDLNIEFSSVNWNFVVHPKSWNAYYCSGPCRSQYMSTLRGQLVSNTNQVIDMDARAGCCTAKETKPLSIMYYDGLNNIVHKKLDDMYITKCGCA